MNANESCKQLDVKELLKIISKNNALLKQKDELLAKLKQNQEIQELEYTTATLTGLTICAKKQETARHGRHY